MFMNSVETEEDTDVDLTGSVLGAVGRALKNSEKKIIFLRKHFLSPVSDNRC